MANTKQITDRTDRKKAKRTLRKALKTEFDQTSATDKKKFRRSETVGFRAWKAEQAAAAAE